MNVHLDRRLSRVAVLAALGLALGLVGCGRKGPLDPPPAASVVEPAAQPAAAPVGPDGKPLPPTVVPPRTSRPFLLDPLLN